MSQNRFKEEPEKAIKSNNKKPNIIIRILKVFMRFLNGEIMTNEWTLKQMPFIFFLVFLAVLNIANIISVERKHRQKKLLDKELTVLRAKHSYYSGRAAKNIKPSELEKKLQHRKLKNSSEPIIKIKK